MDLILPGRDKISRKILRYFIYFVAYGLTLIVPPPLCYLVVQNQQDFKTQLFEWHRVLYDDFWDPKVLAIDIAINHLNGVIVAFFVSFAILYGVGMVIVCSYIIYRNIAKRPQGTSVANRKHHKAVLMSLLAMVSKMDRF